jgi:chromate transporter
MRPVVVGMIASAALLLMFPAEGDDAPSFIDGWSWVIFLLTLLASVKKINPILLIVASGVVGILIYGVGGL